MVNVRSFAATDGIICSIGNLAAISNGAITILYIARKTADAGDWKTIVQGEQASADASQRAVTIDNTSNLLMLTGFNEPDSTLNQAVADNWVLGGVGKNTGAVAIRGHKFVYGTSTWTHANGGTGADSGTNITTGQIRLGHAFWGDSFIGKIAVIGIWIGTVVSDVNIETLTDDINDWLALSPTALYHFNQSAVTEAVNDITGNGADQTSRSGTTVVDDTDLTFNFTVGGDQDLDIPFHQQTNGIFAPTIANQSALSLNPSRLESAVQFFNPTVENQNELILNPARLESTVQIFAPTITGGDQQLHPERIESTTQLFVPILQLQSSLNLGVGFLISSSQLFVPTIENQANLALNVPFRTFTATLFNPTVFNEGDELFEPILVGNGSLADQIMAGLIDQGFLTGTLADREYNRLLSKLTLSVGDNFSIADLYRLAFEENRIAGLEVSV